MKQPIIFFDSGLGGLTIFREARIKIPQYPFIYIADDEAFPYGAWETEALSQHILALMEKIVAQYKPIMVVLACNTASTLVLAQLRQAHPQCLFVGTVPAIKPAAEQTRSGLISLLGTAGTVKRAYTQELIHSFAEKCQVNLVACPLLAQIAEDYLCGIAPDLNQISGQIAPAFQEIDGKRTDIIILACTHYPFLVNFLRKCAPWPVDWIDPAEAIAQHSASLLPPFALNGQDGQKDKAGITPDLAYFTSGKVGFVKQRLLESFGLKVVDLA